MAGLFAAFAAIRWYIFAQRRVPGHHHGFQRGMSGDVVLVCGGVVVVDVDATGGAHFAGGHERNEWMDGSFECWLFGKIPRNAARRN